MCHWNLAPSGGPRTCPKILSSYRLHHNPCWSWAGKDSVPTCLFFSICAIPVRSCLRRLCMACASIAPHATPLPSSPLNSVHICTAQRLISPFYSSTADFRLLSCYSALLFRFEHFLTSVAVCHLFCDRSQYRMRQPH